MPVSVAWLLVFAMVLLMTIAQLLFKAAAIHASENISFVDAWILNIWLSVGIVATVVATLLWFFSLKSLPLSVAYPWTALIYVFTPVASMYIYGDILSLQFFIGMIMVVLGVVITTSGTCENNDEF